MVSDSGFRLAAALLALLMLGLASCVTPGDNSSAAPAAHNPRIPESSSSAVLRPDDSLNIAIQGVPDPGNHNVRVDDQGMISLPFVGTIRAAGIGPAELQQRIIDAYIQKRVYTSLSAAVSVNERNVFVGGEVARPGRIAWSPDLTVSKAIQAAGDFSLYAKVNAVNLSRDNATYVIDVKLAQKNPEEDPRLLPGDSITVPRSRF